MAVAYLTGFEWPNVVLSSTGGGLYNASAGTAPTIVSDFVHTGSYSLKLQPSATSTDCTFRPTADSVQIHVASFDLYFNALPSGGGGNPNEDRGIICQAEESGVRWIGLTFKYADTTISVTFKDGGGATQWLATGPVVKAGVWYHIDLRILTNGTSWTVEWYVDGVQQPTGTQTGRAATNTFFALQTYSSITPGDHRYDNLLYSITSGDYPFGRYYVTSIAPSGAASHQTITTTEWDTGTGLTGTPSWTNFTGQNETTSAPFLDDFDRDNGFRMNTTGAPAGNARWNLSNLAPQFIAPLAARSIIAVREASTGTNNATYRMLGNATTVNIFSGNPGWGTTWNYLALLMTTEPGGAAWTVAKINALQAEADSTDASPNPWCSGWITEVACKRASLMPIHTRRYRRQLVTF